MTIAVNDLFRVEAHGEVFGQKIMLTHAYNVLDTPAGVSEAAASSDLLEELRAGGGSDKWETLYRAVMPPSWTLVKWRVQKVAPIRYRYYQVTRGVLGTHASDTEAPNQSAIITMQTLLAGRNQIGNKHIGPIPQAATVQDGGFLVAAYKTLLSALADAMVDDILGGVTAITFSPVIPHNSPAGSYTLIADYAIGDTVNTMRRRTVGRGE